MMKFSIGLLSSLSAFALAVSASADPKQLDGPVREEGDIAGAAFRIDIPEDWHGGLIMYAHGYALAGTTPEFNTSFVGAANGMGYAVAQSRYTHQGWAAREGILDTEALRRYFADKYGDTYPTIIAGHSQGAAITYATIERYPEAYDGALPMCGAGNTALEFFKERVFDMRLLFDYFLPGLAGSAVDFPDGRATYTKVMAKAGELIKEDPKEAQKFAKMVNLSSAEAIPGTIAFWSEILRELQDRTGGNAFNNRNTLYSGSDDDVKLNHEIPRFDRDAASVEYLGRWVTLSGDISDPVLAIHTMVDDLIPPSIAGMYDSKTVAAGTSDLYVLQYVEHEGHCNFTNEEMKVALEQLHDWIENGKRPVATDITSD